MQQRLRGVIAATPTPIRDDLSIDHDRLIAHCGWLLGDGGCNGVNLLGTTGEATSFSTEQRLAAMRAVASSGLPLSHFMVGTGAAALGDAVTLTCAARDLGFAGALLLPPFYYKDIGEAGLVAYVDALLERTGRQGLRLYLYHFPKNSGVPWSVETVARLRERHPGVIAGLKDSSSDLDYSRALARLDDFDVFPGSEGTLAQARQAGFAGCISATTNVSGPWAREAWRASDEETAFRAAAQADAIRDALRRFPLVSSVKWALADLKGDPAWLAPHPPLERLTEVEGRQLRSALARTAYAGAAKPGVAA